MKKLMTGFVCALTCAAFAQNSTPIEKMEKGEITIKPHSFISALSKVHGNEYAGLTFTFTSKDKSRPEDNYYQVQTSECKDKTIKLFETTPSGKLKDYQIANLQKAESLTDKLAQAICTTYAQYKQSPEQFRHSAAFIQNVINNSSSKQWTTLFENKSSNIAVLKEYSKVEKGIVYAIIRTQDLTENQKVTSTQIAKINFPVSKCSAKIINVKIETLEGMRKSIMPIDLSDEASAAMVLKLC